MTPEEFQETWNKQIQEDAERGVIECRVCKTKASLDEAITLWRNGALVFAVCDCCINENHILISRASRGIEVRTKRREPMAILSSTK